MKGKNNRKKRMLLPLHGVVDFTSRKYVVEFAVQVYFNTLKRSSACKFSEEKINQIVVTLRSVSVFRDETLIFA